MNYVIALLISASTVYILGKMYENVTTKKPYLYIAFVVSVIVSVTAFIVALKTSHP